jgi:hypothetical protein
MPSQEEIAGGSWRCTSTRGEMTEVNLSEEEVEKRLSKEPAELESAVKWHIKATSNGDRVGDQVDLPFTQHEEVMQQAPKKEAMGPNAFKINSVCDAGAAEGGQPVETAMEEEEHTLECAQEMEKEEHSVELLKNFSEGDEHEATVELEPTAEEKETDRMDLVDLCEEMEALGKIIITQRGLIQQVKLEIDGEKMQQSRLQEESQPVDQLDKEIEEIKRLMLEATKKASNNREGWDRREPAGAAGKQEQQIKGASGQLQFQVWDPGGSQQHSRGSHE